MIGKKSTKLVNDFMYNAVRTAVRIRPSPQTELIMIKKKLTIKKLYNGKFPNKGSVKLTAEAVVELQKEVTALERLLVSKGIISELELRSMFDIYDR